MSGDRDSQPRSKGSTTGRQMLSQVRNVRLPPDVFEVVMATGILSIAAQDHSYTLLDLSLAGLAAITFVFLCIGFLMRMIARPLALIRHARETDVALRLFTFVAACAVLGARFHTNPWVLWSLAGLTGAGWFILSALTVEDIHASSLARLRSRAHGAWLLGSVATAGLAITAANLAINTQWMLWTVLAISAWILAMVLYLITACFIVLATSRPIAVHSIEPDAWVLMGAVAICAVAGIHVRTVLASQGMLSELAVFIHLAIIVLWLAASAWIPILLSVQIRQYTHHRNESVHFTRAWWAAVFPLGMYSTATQAAAPALQSDALTDISVVVYWVAFGIWILVTAHWLHSRISSADDIS